MHKTITTLTIIISLFFGFNVFAAEKSILDTLIPSKKNCNYVSKQLYQPFSDINEDFPAVGGLMKVGADKEKSCVDVSSGTENILSLFFRIAISLIIVLTVINITVAGIQYMTENATGKVQGGANKRLKDSLIALALGLFSYTILYTVNKQLVNFDFNPVSIDIDNSVGKGVQSANVAQIGGFSTTINEAVGVGGFYGGQQGGAGGVPFVGGGGSDSFLDTFNRTGSWDERTVENWVRSLKNGQRSTDGRLVITVYSATNDSITDTNTAQRRGNRNNLLREGSVALSPDLISRYKPQTGEEIFINGLSVGFYEDATASIYNGVVFNNTIDIYDENKSLGGSYLKNIPGGQWSISFGPNKRAQILNP